MKWNGCKAVVTGGAGFIGSNLTARLAREGARVRVADNLERGRREYLEPVRSDIEFLESDLRDPDNALTAVKDADVVFHLAAKVGGIGVYRRHAGTILSNNILIDQNVIVATVKRGVNALFYAGTAHVYPEDLQQTPDSPALKEEDAYPANPGLSYGWGKLIGERSALHWAEETGSLHVAAARITGAYGYNQDIALETGSVIPVFCHRAAKWPEGAPFRVWGTGNETRSYCFIDDIVEGIIRCAEAADRERIAGPMNLGSEGRATISEIAAKVISGSGKDIDIRFDDSIETTIWGQAVDCSLARKTLNGWTPRIGLDEGIRLTYEHVRSRVETGEDGKG